MSSQVLAGSWSSSVSLCFEEVNAVEYAKQRNSNLRRLASRLGKNYRSGRQVRLPWRHLPWLWLWHLPSFSAKNSIVGRSFKTAKMGATEVWHPPGKKVGLLPAWAITWHRWKLRTASRNRGLKIFGQPKWPENNIGKHRQTRFWKFDPCRWKAGQESPTWLAEAAPLFCPEIISPFACGRKWFSAVTIHQSSSRPLG